MGNQLVTSGVGIIGPQTAVDYSFHDIPGFVYETSLGKGRFLKSIKCVHDEGPVVVKVFIKPQDTSIVLKDHIERLRGIFLNFTNSLQTWPC